MGKTPARGFRDSLLSLILWIVAYIIITAVVNIEIPNILASIGISIQSYMVYINIALALFFGYMIVRSVSNMIYWSLRARYDHPQAAAVRSIIVIVGIGGLLASIAGGVAGGAAGVSLGGFLGIVVGFASQQILGQAVAGLFLLIARPISIGDTVSIAGESGRVEDITTLFIHIRKDDGTLVLIPNNTVIGSKLYVIKRYRS